MAEAAPPSGPWWGTSSWSTGVEGSAPASDWRRWEDQGRVPASGDGNGFAGAFADDFAALAGLGLRHVRLVLEWARLEPAQGKPDGAAFEQARVVLEAARAAGLEPWVGLHHVSLPGWFTEEGGFADDRCRGRWWPRHVDRCAQTFGDLVAGWTPLYEPSGYALEGWLTGRHPPGVQDPGELAKVLRGVTIAQRDAWRELRGGGPPVATAWNLAPVAATDDSPEATDLAARLDAVLWRLGVRAVRDGVVDLPGRAPEEVPDLAGCADWAGATYFGGLGIGGDGTVAPWPPGAPAGPDGRRPWPEGLGRVLRRLAEELPDRPLLVAGTGVGSRDDRTRRAVLEETAGVVADAVADGCDVRGVFVWTGIDAYEGTLGFEVPFGLLDRSRRPRDSALALAERLRAPA